MSLVKPLVAYKFFKEIINFIRIYWNNRKKFYPGYFFCTQHLTKRLNGVLTTLLLLIIDLKENNVMDELLVRFFERLEFSFQRKLSRYIIKAQRNDFRGQFEKFI